MKSLIKKIKQTELGLALRNTLNIRPVEYFFDDLKSVSVSDAFLWRTDNNFITKFKYSDIFNIFYKIKNSWVEFHFYSKNNEFLKTEKIHNLDYSNEIVIDSDYLNNLKDYGVFYIYHFTNEKISEENIISNRCYLGYSQNNKPYSFVHGNTLARYQKINNDEKVSSNTVMNSINIVQSSIFKNQYYKIQKYFDGFDKNELFFSNPTSKVINFSIDNQNYTLKPACSRLIDIFDQKIITIKSNCLYLRPTVFSYKSNYMDVHHS